MNDEKRFSGLLDWGLLFSLQGHCSVSVSVVMAMADESNTIAATWHIHVQNPKANQSLPPLNDTKSFTLKSLHLKDIINGVAEIKQHVNAQMTFWKDAIEGQGEITVSKDDEEQEDNDSE